jgi:hypothetical protein
MVNSKLETEMKKKYLIQKHEIDKLIELKKQKEHGHSSTSTSSQDLGIDCNIYPTVISNTNVKFTEEDLNC